MASLAERAANRERYGSAMRVSMGDLNRFGSSVPPAPEPIRPLLAPDDEARLIAKDERGDP